MGNDQPLVHLTVEQFLSRLASDTPTPGGGSVAALVAALAASLGRMACAFTVGRERFTDVEPQVAEIQRRLQQADQMLQRSIQEDSDAYASLAAAFKLKRTDPERQPQIESAAAIAAGVPFQTVVLSKRVLVDLRGLLSVANPNLRSDVEAAIHLAEAARAAAAANTRINLPYMNKDAGARVARELDELLQQ